MSKTNSQHAKTQNLLLISKLLDCRENISPFTLILDSLNQSASPVLGEFLVRAQSAEVNTIFVGFESLRPPAHANHVVRAYALEPRALQKEIAKIIAASQATRNLIILDTLHPLLSHPIHLPSYLTGLLAASPPPTSAKATNTPTATPPSTSMIAVYHADQPTPHSPAISSPYSPNPLTLLAHLATTVLTVHSPSHVLARRRARERSLAAPVFGLEESIEAHGGHEAEGTLQGLGANDTQRVVLDGDVRRRSGRAIGVCFVLDWTGTGTGTGTTHANVRAKKQRAPLKGEVVLLADHPLFRAAASSATAAAETAGLDAELGEVSFNLGLTEKQRRDREGVVLPYFDAQSESGAVGDGGRILYDMGVEDDFDEEEDEI